VLLADTVIAYYLAYCLATWYATKPLGMQASLFGACPKLG